MSIAATVAFLLFCLLGMPLAFALGFSALLALPLGGVDLNMLPQRMMHSINAFPLMAISLFMLAGELMLRGGLAERMVELANAFIGRVAGGLAQVTILAGAGLSAVSGAAVADASALGTLLMRELTKVYGVGFAAAIIAAAAALQAHHPAVQRHDCLRLHGGQLGISGRALHGRCGARHPAHDRHDGDGLRHRQAPQISARW